MHFGTQLMQFFSSSFARWWGYPVQNAGSVYVVWDTRASVLETVWWECNRATSSEYTPDVGRKGVANTHTRGRRYLSAVLWFAKLSSSNSSCKCYCFGLDHKYLSDQSAVISGVLRAGIFELVPHYGVQCEWKSHDCIINNPQGHSACDVKRCHRNMFIRCLFLFIEPIYFALYRNLSIPLASIKIGSQNFNS